MQNKDPWILLLEYEMSSVTIDHVVKENGGNFVYCSDGL
jgi:hypothetical protein